MLPQIHLDFGPTAFDRFYQLCLPLMPGTVFVGGFLMARPGLGPWFQDAVGVGLRTELVVFQLI